uniref:Arginyl-tRNA--protein transferase 1 n=1 Tax=Lynceus sp. MCZ IZ 141354 TaxID=1930659 RepID=A0A9N6WVR8_9CRUS|nr:EOG090X06AF [Lynceus sp. MCZ IZ 141354]
MDEYNGPSIVQYLGPHKDYKCGYCKGVNSNYSHGMWASVLTVEDYQALIDRGFRRSGCYCYKPAMDKICCPQYTIRCLASDFKLGKSHKKVLKRMHKFLATGAISHPQRESTDHDKDTDAKPVREKPAVSPHTVEIPRELQNMKKAKIRRMERKALVKKETVKLVKRSANEAKTLEDFLHEPLPEKPAHTLTVKLVRSHPRSEEFKRTLAASHALYLKYQVTVHKDKPEKCGLEQYCRFLVDSPLEDCYPESGPEMGYGSFHQQYWLDERLIAVGVIDILPHCLSSVYFYYDPDYSFLSLGTYASLQEIAFVRQLALPTLQWYYLGFYIHSCTKMRYKGQYKPSFLLCPEAFTWHPIEECLPKLELSNYCRFNCDSANVAPVVSLGNVLVLYRRQAMKFSQFKALYERKGNEEEDSICEYSKLVGPAATRILFYIH